MGIVDSLRNELVALGWFTDRLLWMPYSSAQESCAFSVHISEAVCRPLRIKVPQSENLYFSVARSMLSLT